MHAVRQQDMVRKLTIFVFACLIVGTAGTSVEIGSPTVGAFRGRVEDRAFPTKGLQGANVAVFEMPTRTRTDGDGNFMIDSIPAGTYRVTVAKMGYRAEQCTVSIVAGNETSQDFHLTFLDYCDAVAMAESAGVDVNVEAEQILCEIVPGKDDFQVGDLPEFDVVLRNGSKKSFFLIYSVEGSAEYERYPYAALEIHGPKDGIAIPGGALIGCGWLNRIRYWDFEWLQPGDFIKVYRNGHGWMPIELYYGRFVKPGRYVVTFHYSTKEGDTVAWLGRGDMSEPEEGFWELLHLVPRVELIDSIEVLVTE
jgi:hypothetical protein